MGEHHAGETILMQDRHDCKYTAGDLHDGKNRSGESHAAPDHPREPHDDDDGGFDIFDECSLHFDDAVTAKRVAAFRIRVETQKQSLSLSLFSLFLPRARLFESAFSRLSRGFFLSFSRNPKEKKRKM